LSTSQKPKNRPFRAKTGKPGGNGANPGSAGAGSRPGGGGQGQPQGGRRGRGRPEAEGNRADRPAREPSSERQPKSNASAIGLSDLGGGRGNWRARRQGGAASLSGTEGGYPLASSELLPRPKASVPKSRRIRPIPSPSVCTRCWRRPVSAPGAKSRSGSLRAGFRSMASLPM
jgi:hypothetical protein